MSRPVKSDGSTVDRRQTVLDFIATRGRSQPPSGADVGKHLGIPTTNAYQLLDSMRTQRLVRQVRFIQHSKHGWHWASTGRALEHAAPTRDHDDATALLEAMATPNPHILAEIRSSRRWNDASCMARECRSPHLVPTLSCKQSKPRLIHASCTNHPAPEPIKGTPEDAARIRRIKNAVKRENQRREVIV